MCKHCKSLPVSDKPMDRDRSWITHTIRCKLHSYETLASIKFGEDSPQMILANFNFGDLNTVHHMSMHLI